MILSDAQVAAVASEAGFQGSDLTTAVAICNAESSRETTVSHLNTDGSTDYGLWQINSVHNDLLAAGSWSDPASNARMAFAIYVAAGRKFTPWTTYNSGAFLPFMPAAAAAAKQPDTNIPATVNGPPTQGAATPGSFGAVVTAGSTWARIGEFIAGIALIVVAFIGLSKTKSLIGAK